MHTNGLDEAFAIPTEEAMKLAIRTQQIIRDEINVTSVVDPLGGSYFVERLTNDMEEEIWKVLAKVDERGGAIKLVEEGWFQQQLADSAYATFKKIETGQKFRSASIVMSMITPPAPMSTFIPMMNNAPRFRLTVSMSCAQAVTIPAFMPC